MTTASRLLIAGLTLGLLAACQSGTDDQAAIKGAVVERSVEASAVVQSVDQETRLVVLERDDGTTVKIVAGSEVRNLAQVDPGDRVVVRYLRAIAAQMAQPGAAKTEAATASARAPEGEKPAALAGAEIRTTVRIVSVDMATNQVVFTPPDGIVRSVVVREPEMQAFVGTLKPGDEVDVTFTEALAISVEPVGS